MHALKALLGGLHTEVESLKREIEAGRYSATQKHEDSTEVEAIEAELEQQNRFAHGAPTTGKLAETIMNLPTLVNSINDLQKNVKVSTADPEPNHQLIKAH